MFPIGSGYVKSDFLSAIVYPIVLVVGLTVIGEVVVQSGLLRGWYATQYAVLCMFCASRICVRSGIWCALLAMVVHSYVFLPNKWGWDVPSVEQSVTYASMLVGSLLVGRSVPARIDMDTDKITPSTPLPFVLPDSASDTGTDQGRFWSVPEPTGVWRDDCRLGSQYARIYIESWHRTGGGPLLAWVVRDMVRKGRYSGIETGFVSAVARAALQRCPAEDRATLLVAANSSGPNDNADNAQSEGSVI